MTFFSKKTLTFCISLLSFLTVHGQYFYIAEYDGTAIQFENQGDVSLSISYPLKNRNSLHLGFCPVKHISLSGGIFNHQRLNQFYSLPDIKTKGRSYSGAIGFYNFFKSPFESKSFVLKNFQGFLLQSHFGYSANKISNFIDDLKYTDLYAQNYFFKWSIHLKYKRLSLSYATKYIILDFKKAAIVGEFPPQSIYLTRLFFYVEDHAQQEFTERTLSIQYKLKFFELFIHKNILTSSLKVHSPYSHFDKQYYNIGLILDLSELYKDIRNKKH